MPANAGQQVRGDRAKRSDDQGRVQERAQQIGHEQVHGVEPRVGQHVRRHHRQVEPAELAPVERVGLERADTPITRSRATRPRITFRSLC